MSVDILKASGNISRENLVSCGTCFGKFTKSGKFRITSTCIDILAQYATHKVWVKPQVENSFLYGNHILKAGLGRITEDTPQYQGVVVLSMSDTPLGFGITARSTEECRSLNPTDIVCLHQSDVGEYLRNESSLNF